MTAIAFALVSSENQDKIFAYGLEIDLPTGRDVITFRREADGQTMFGMHQSVESARQRYSAVTPLELVWEPN
ncbi:hypothetical protein [Actinophytocola sediminis]